MGIFNKIIILSLVMNLFACAEVKNTSNSSSSSSSSSNSSLSEVFTLAWTPPSQYENGDLLIPDVNLLEYRIYYGNSANTITDNFISVSPSTTSVSTTELNPSIISAFSTVYLAMTSVSSDGVESSFSEVISFTP